MPGGRKGTAPLDAQTSSAAVPESVPRRAVVGLATWVQERPSKCTMVPFSPTAQTSFVSLPQTATSDVVTGEAMSVQALPSKCSIAPLSPTAHTSSADTAQTPRRVKAAGDGFSHRQPFCNPAGGKTVLAGGAGIGSSELVPDSGGAPDTIGERAPEPQPKYTAASVTAKTVVRMSPSGPTRKLQPVGGHGNERAPGDAGQAGKQRAALQPTENSRQRAVNRGQLYIAFSHQRSPSASCRKAMKASTFEGTSFG